MTTQISLMTSAQVTDKCESSPLWAASQLLRLDALLHKTNGDVAEANGKLATIVFDLKSLCDELEDDNAEPDVSNAGG